MNPVGGTAGPRGTAAPTGFGGPAPFQRRFSAGSPVQRRFPGSIRFRGWPYRNPVGAPPALQDSAGPAPFQRRFSAGSAPVHRFSAGSPVQSVSAAQWILVVYSPLLSHRLMRDPLEHGSNRASGSRTVRRFKSKWTYTGKNVCARQSLETFFFLDAWRSPVRRKFEPGSGSNFRKPGR